MRDVKLPSGATLKVAPSPFAVSKALYQAVLRELKSVTVNSKSDMAELYKSIFCTGFASAEIEACLWECFKRCTYNDGRGGADLKIDQDTFEPLERRDDYMVVCTEVAKDNILPFVKSLFAGYKEFLSMTANIQL